MRQREREKECPAAVEEGAKKNEEIPPARGKAKTRERERESKTRESAGEVVSVGLEPGAHWA